MTLADGLRRAQWRHLTRYTRYVARAFVVFRRPLEVLRCYVRRELPPGGVIELRSGLRIRLSSDPLDVVTAFVVFVRRDYGAIRRGATVVDVGANIGVFALYAAEQGAARVIAYEPSRESFACLEQNVALNGLAARIATHRAAVVGTAGERIPFAVRSSVFNSVAQTGGATEPVDTTDLRSIVGAVGQVDLLKLDCEGAEYDIVLNTPPETLARIADLRLEYHGDRRPIERHLADAGFHSRVPESAEGAEWHGWFTLAGERR